MNNVVVRNIEFEKALWHLLDAIRGKIDNSHLHRYILPILFLKYISDDWHIRRADLAARLDNETLIDRRMQRGRFILPEAANFNALQKTAKPDLSRAINNALILLEQANQHKLAGLFKNIDYNSPLLSGAPDKVWMDFLDGLIRLAGGTDFSTHMEDIFPWVLSFSPVVSPGNTNYYFTPDTLADLLVKLIMPKAGDRIYDPSCNFGKLLIKAADAVTDDHGNRSEDFSLFGQGISDEMTRYLRMYMIMRNLDDARIVSNDPIRNPIRTAGEQLLKFDVLLSNLPWNIENWGIQEAKMDPDKRFQWGIPPEKKGDWAYIQHMLAVASDKGRVAVIVPHGLLFREGRELLIRKAVVENNLLEAVISLPLNLFYSTKLPCAILLFNKNKAKNKNTLFIDASKEFKAEKRQHSLREEDINHILSAWNCFRKNPNEAEKSLELNYSVVVTIKTIAANNYNLNVSRYIKQLNNEDSPAIDIHALKAELDSLNNQLMTIRTSILHQFSQLGVKVK